MDTQETARAAIEARIADYIEGWYGGDPVRMDRCLHRDLVKRTLSDGVDPSRDLRDVTKDRMVEMTAAGGGDMADPSFDIQVHHISERIASAHVRSPEYLDDVQLILTDEGWKIVNVLFETHQ